MGSGTADQRQPHVAVIGSGFAGIGLAVELRRAGFTRVTIFEKAPEVGGVWRDNTYPGAACDVPSHLYSYSFEPNPEWTMRFATQPEILRYLRECVDKHGLAPHLRLNTEVVGAEYDEARAKWVVRTGDGEQVEADVLVPAIGQLSRPSSPRLPGLDGFRGRAFHSARWDHDYELAGKRVGVVGTGASAVQFIPAIADRVEQLTVFQRSAPYVVPKPDRVYRRRHGRWPQQLARFGFWSFFEFAALGLTRAKAVGGLFALVARHHLRKQVGEEAKRQALRPDHQIGCKRVLFSNTYYPALTKPTVRIERERIEEVTAHGLRTADGTEHELDAIIFGTGFEATRFLAPMTVRGSGGRDLADTWEQGAHAYLGMAVPGFPNMFLMYGPNTNVGSGSVVNMLESQARYIVRLVELLSRQPGTALDVRPSVEKAYDEEIQQRLTRSVWTSCASWYRDASGRISTNWPGFMAEYRRRTSRLRPDDYRLTRAHDAATTAR